MASIAPRCTITVGCARGGAPVPSIKRDARTTTHSGAMGTVLISPLGGTMPYFSKETSLNSGYAEKLYFVPLTLLRTTQTASSSTNGIATA